MIQSVQKVDLSDLLAVLERPLGKQQVLKKKEEREVAQDASLVLLLQRTLYTVMMENIFS